MSANLLRVLISGAILLMISCSKTTSKPAGGNPVDSTGTNMPGGGTTTSKTTDIYVCGADNGIACYWKNDSEVLLPARGSTYGLASSVVVHGTDVYVAGCVSSGTNNVPVYWKNGNGVSLQPRTTSGIPAIGNFCATGISFADTNVYVAVDQAAIDRDNPRTESYLKIGPSGASSEYGVSDQLNAPAIGSIFVSGTDVYCAGSGLKGTGYLNSVPQVDVFPAYFKNGAEIILPPSQGLLPVEDYVRGEAAGVAVSGNDVYVVGWQQTNFIGQGTDINGRYCTLWKNNAPQLLPWTNGAPVSGFPTSIFLADNNVYISGAIDNEAVYWKNNVITICENTNSTGRSSYGASIGVSPNGDVYVAGYDGNTAAVWKNGTRKLMGTAGNSQATGIFVYTH